MQLRMSLRKPNYKIYEQFYKYYRMIEENYNRNSKNFYQSEVTACHCMLVIVAIATTGTDTVVCNH